MTTEITRDIRPLLAQTQAPSGVALGKRRSVPEGTGGRRTPKIVAVILAGGNREALIMGAVASLLGHVDEIVLMVTGPSAEAAVDTVLSHHVACPVTPDRRYYVHGDRFDCASARNAGLDAARERGADWILGLDTDERMIWGDVGIHDALAHADADLIWCRSDLDEYPKTRFIRGTCRGAYHDRLHEEFRGESDITVHVMHGVVFHEVPKSPEELDRIMRHVWNTCDEWIVDEPENPKPHMHRGNALIWLAANTSGDEDPRDLYEGAVDAFRSAAQIHTHEESKAWCTFRAGEALGELDRLEEALETACVALRWAPHFGEIYCLAAHVSIKRGRPLDALAWADCAIALGKTAQLTRVEPTRGGFSIPPCRWEVPWMLRATALEMLADPAMVDLVAQADGMAEKAQQARMSGGK